MLRGQLQKIPVPGKHRDLHALLLASLRHGSQKVVRLQPGLFHGQNPHGVEHLLEDRHLLVQLLGHGLSGALISIIHFMPEGRRLDVEGHRQIIRLFLIQHLEKCIQKTKNGVRVKALGIRQIRHAVERPVDNAVSVHQQNFLAHNFSISVTIIAASAAMASAWESA